MKIKKSCFYVLSITFLTLVFGAADAWAQPTDAQTRKHISNPNTVSITFNGRGSVEWSKGYKKYIWMRYFTEKRSTETKGEFLIVRGYAAYDIVGGRYVFWRVFASDSKWEGKKNVTVDEINQALGSVQLEDFTNQAHTIIGEYESYKMAPNPDWEWHTQNSVSFNTVAVYRIAHNGTRYDNGDWFTPPSGFLAADRVEVVLRLRIYREGAGQPWSNIHVTNAIPIPDNRNYTKEFKKLLSREILPQAEVERMPRMTEVPKMMP